MIQSQSIGNGIFYLGDCFDVMATAPSESIDLIFTDPPYRTISGGTNSESAKRWTNSILGKNDGKIFANNDVSIAQYMSEFFRLLKPETHCYVMTNNLNLRELLNCAEDVGFKFHNLLAWKKNTCTANRWYMKELELVCFFYKQPAKKINNPSSKQLFSFDTIRNKIHPTEKPIELLEHYIANSSKEGACVFDPFAGSGSTALAAEKLNRQWVTCELDETYANAAVARIKAHIEKPQQVAA